MERFWRDLRWLWGTSWPLYAATVLGTNVIAAIGSMLFVRYLIPMPEVRELGLGGQLGAIGVIYAAVAVVLGIVVTLYLFRPVLEWQRHPDGHDPNMVRHLVMRLPVLQTIIVVGVWGIGIAIVAAGAWRVDVRLATVVLATASLTAFVTAVLTYLQAERLVRPIAASALARRFEDSTLQPPIKWQLYLTWFTTSAVPMVGVLLLTVAQRHGYFTGNVGELTSAIVALITAGMATGFVGTALVIMSCLLYTSDAADE